MKIKSGFFIPKKYLCLLLEIMGITLIRKTFVFQLDDLPVYITYIHKSKNDTLIIKDVGSNDTVTINTNLNDSITTLFFVLSLVKKEYQSGILFTSKSNFVK